MSNTTETEIITEHAYLLSKYGVQLDTSECKVPTMYWLPKLHKRPYKQRFISNSCSSTTTILSKLLTSCLATIKEQTVKLSEKVFERSQKNIFWSIKNSNDVLQRLKTLNNQARSISCYDFSTLYTSLPHNLIIEKITDLIQKTFNSMQCDFIACNTERAFFTNNSFKDYNIWSCQKLCNALEFLLNNIFVQFDNKIYKQVIGIPMGTNCAPLIADLFLYCYERDFMLKLKPDTQSDIIDAFNKTCRYLDDIFNVNNDFFHGFYKDIYPNELCLSKANDSDSKASFLDLDLTIENNNIITKIYDKRDDFNFDIVNFPHLDGDVPKRTSYGVYISQLIRYARACTKVEDFNCRNLLLTTKLLKQGYRYHKLCRTFTTFYRKYNDLISKYSCNLKTLILHGIREPEFYGDVIYKLRKLLGHTDFNNKFVYMIRTFIKRGYSKHLLRHTCSMLLHPVRLTQFSNIFN